MMRVASGMGTELRVPALLVLGVLMVFGREALAINDAMTAINERGDVAFVESPGEEVCDDCGISLFIRPRGGGQTRLVSNGDPIGRCDGGPNDDDNCTIDAQCPEGECDQDSVVSGFAKRICMNDNGIVTARVGLDESFEDPSSTNDSDSGGAIVTAGEDQPTTVIARSCDLVPNNFLLTCPDPASDINNAGQVSFSADISSQLDLCPPNNINLFCNTGTPGLSRAIYRFSPGVGLEEMLRNGDMIGANTVTEPSVSSSGGVDADSKLNPNGIILTRARYAGNVDANVLLKAPGTRVEIAREGGNPFDEIDEGVINGATPVQVLFKGITGGVERIVLFTEGSGLDELAVEGDNTPQSEGEFEGFGHFYCINNIGQAAFVAGLQNTGVAIGAGAGGADNDPQAQGLYFWDGNDLIEIARSASANPGTSISSINGFEIEWFMNAVVINDAGTVCFAAEHSTDSGTDNEPTAVFCWNQATGFREIFRDGNIVQGFGDTSFVPGMQTFKRILNDSGDMAFPVDPTGSEDESDDNFVLFTTFDRFRAAAPLLSAGALAAVAGLLVFAGVRRLRRREP